MALNNSVCGAPITEWKLGLAMGMLPVEVLSDEEHPTAIRQARSWVPRDRRTYHRQRKHQAALLDRLLQSASSGDHLMLTEWRNLGLLPELTSCLQQAGLTMTVVRCCRICWRADTWVPKFCRMLGVWKMLRFVQQPAPVSASCPGIKEGSQAMVG